MLMRRRPGKLNRDQFVAKWQNLQKNCATQPTWPLAVIDADKLLDEALKTATQIAAMPPMAAMVNKEMVNAAFEMGLDQGIRHERRLFQILAATEDKAEGMKAFVKKREAKWKGR